VLEIVRPDVHGRTAERRAEDRGFSGARQFRAHCFVIVKLGEV
jgi:hypothetical protein